VFRESRTLASASDDKTVKVWDGATGQEVLTLKGHTGPVASVAFSPDGKRLASASFDKTVKVWDAVTGQETLTLQGHTDAVLSVGFSPDGQRLASASGDKTVKVWEAEPALYWHLREVADAEKAQRWFAAAFHLGQAIDQERGYLVREAVIALSSQPTLGSLLGLQALRSRDDRQPLNSLLDRRAEVFAEQGEWNKALDDLAAARRLAQADPRLAHRQAWASLAREVDVQRTRTAPRLAVALAGPWSLLAVAGLPRPRRDVSEFLRICTEMEHDFGATRDATTADAVAWTRLLVPDGLDREEAGRLVDLSRRGMEAQPESADYLETHGAALYRAGRFREAVEQLEKAVAKNGEGGSPWQQLFLAMAHHRLGEEDEARRCLERANRQIEEKMNPKEKATPRPSWEQRLQWGLLRAEAEEVLARREENKAK
jgi:hypothetical protein